MEKKTADKIREHQSVSEWPPEWNSFQHKKREERYTPSYRVFPLKMQLSFTPGKN